MNIFSKRFYPRNWLYYNILVSKIGLSALSRIQQRELAKDNRKDIVVNHVHPGACLTFLINGILLHMPIYKSVTIKVPVKVRPDNSATVSILPNTVLPTHLLFVCNSHPPPNQQQLMVTGHTQDIISWVFIFNLIFHF